MKPQGTWCSARSRDPFVSRATGSDEVKKITFGTCPRGDVVGYRFKDEAHTPSLKKQFDPKVSGSELLLEHARRTNGGGRWCDRKRWRVPMTGSCVRSVRARRPARQCSSP